MLLGEDSLVDVVGQPHVEQPILLLDEERLLPGEFSPLSAAVSLGVPRLRGQHHAEPVADAFVLDPHLVEDRQHLAFDVRFLHPDARVVILRIAGAAVVDVLVDAAVLPLLPDQFAGDGMAAVAAGYELARVGQRGGVVDVITEQSLHPVPGRAVDQRFVLAGKPMSLVVNFADIGPVLQDRVNRGSGKLRLRRAVHPALGVDPLDYAVKRQILVSVEMEHPLDVVRLQGIGFDDAAAVLADVAIAVGSGTAEPAFLDAAGDALADID